MKVLTLFCAVLFLAITTPAEAKHPFRTNFVCTTWDAASEAVEYAERGKLAALRARTTNDRSFKCYLADPNMQFTVDKIVHRYWANGVSKAVVLARDPIGAKVFAFGTLYFINSLLHAEDA